MKTDNFHLYIGSKAGLTANILKDKDCKCSDITKFEISEDGWFHFKFFEGKKTYYYGSEDLPTLILRPLGSMSELEMVVFHNLSKHFEIVKNTEKVAWMIKEGFDIGLIPKGRYVLTTELE